MDNQIRNRIFLAALLHDIGKFYQRSDKSFSDRYNTLSAYSKKISTDICPLNENGRFGYRHVVWTNEFIEKYNLIFDKVPGIKSRIYDDNNAGDSMASLACNHHKPHSENQALVTLADWWSAGIDRTNSTTLEKERLEKEYFIQWGGDRYKRIPLYSVFNDVNGGNCHKAFNLNELNKDSRTFFPKEISKVSDGNTSKDYKKLWEEFCNEFVQLPTDSFNGFSESLVYLLKKYTWCIPSNTMDMANVSLYEHLKTTAAFADCFYLYREENPSAFKWDGSKVILDSSLKPVILLGGDVSGIQKYIYDISSQKAAVSLKGRSFYIQLLIDSVIQKIISHPDIDATLAQVVYSSGGKFYMLLPNTSKVLAAIADLHKEFDRWLWSEHKGSLLLNMDYVAFSYDVRSKRFMFEGSNDNSTIGDLWRVLAEKLTSRKGKKFESIIKDMDLFSPKEITLAAKVCALTGVEGECENISNNSTEPLWVLPSVKKQIELGTVLKDADYIITYSGTEEHKYLNNRAKFDKEILGVHNYLFDKSELAGDGSDFRRISSVDVCRVKCINQFIIPQLKGNSCSYGFQFYGGNKQAQTSNGDNKTFEELARGAYLGVLRMDVDNLGALFISGLPESSKSFSAYSTLSFMLDWFFSGYLNTIRDSEDFMEDVNILYSGGDDVFAVGRWDKLILFAEKIRIDFAKFVGREDISISAGVVINKADYPIAKSALQAGEAESSAKTFERDGLPKKNAINMFGENISWHEEFDIVKNRKGEFVDLINAGMPRSILHRLMALSQDLKKGNMSYMWHTAYFLKRFSEQQNDAVKKFCNCLKNELCDARKYELTAVAARWAELELKFNHN